MPQRRPLLFLVPDVRSLERRHHEVLRLHEDILRGADVRFHQTARPVYSVVIPIIQHLTARDLVRLPTLAGDFENPLALDACRGKSRRLIQSPAPTQHRRGTPEV